jgi:hypothetical protein
MKPYQILIKSHTMASMLRSNRRTGKIKARQLVVGLSMLCIVISLSVVQRSSMRKHDMPKHSQTCKCIHEKQEINLLHAIPLLLLPALETSDTEQLSVTNQQNCFAPVNDKKERGERSSTSALLFFEYPRLENSIY